MTAALGLPLQLLNDGFALATSSISALLPPFPAAFLGSLYVGPHAMFDEAELSGADFTGANLEQSTFRGAKLDDVTWEGANLDGALGDGGAGAR